MQNSKAFARSFDSIFKKENLLKLQKRVDNHWNDDNKQKHIQSHKVFKRVEIIIGLFKQFQKYNDEPDSGNGNNYLEK